MGRGIECFGGVLLLRFAHVCGTYLQQQPLGGTAAAADVLQVLMPVWPASCHLAGQAAGQLLQVVLCQCSLQHVDVCSPSPRWRPFYMRV